MNTRSIETLTVSELIDLLAELERLKSRAERRLAEITADELLSIGPGEGWPSEACSAAKHGRQ